MSVNRIRAFASVALLSGLLSIGLAGNANAISVNLNPVTKSCALNISGAVASTIHLPATAVSIDFLPPNGATPVRLATNLVLGPPPTAPFTWNGEVPGYPSIPANSQVRATTNRQVSATAPAPVCEPPA